MSSYNIFPELLIKYVPVLRTRIVCPHTYTYNRSSDEVRINNKEKVLFLLSKSNEWIFMNILEI